MSKQYPGVCHGLVESTGLSCHIQVRGTGLEVNIPERTPFRVSYVAMEVSFTGVDDRYLCLRGPVDGRDIRLLVPDKAIVDDIVASGAPGGLLSVVRRVEQSRGRRRGLRWGVFAALGGIVLIIVLSVTAGFRFAADRAVDLIPPQWESVIGRTVAQGMLAESKVCSDPQVQRAAQEIGLRLVGGLGATPYNFKIRVIDAPEVNAFALPGGYVFVNRGLLEASSDGDEVAGVLAHEMEHVVLRHGLSNIVRQAGLAIILSAIIGDVDALEQILLRNAASLMDMSFSRDQESAADEAGLKLMHRAGLDPTGLPRFLLKLENTQGIAAAIPSFLSTHPASADRSAELNELIGQLRPATIRPLSFDATAIQGKCDPVSMADPDAP